MCSAGLAVLMSAGGMKFLAARLLRPHRGIGTKGFFMEIGVRGVSMKGLFRVVYGDWGTEH